ncbi:MAG TPA: carbohydrate kinase family protein [Polyangia bacterium]|nr:carbohydrate kinase family protein [Polyangia bacterium]
MAHLPGPGVAAFQERLRRPGRWDVIGLGESSWDEVWRLAEVPPWGGKARAVDRISLGGGQVATAMVACRRLGLQAAYLGWVGDDDVGRHIVQGLAAEGVDTGGVHVLVGASHGAVIVVDARGERTVLFHEDRGQPPAELTAVLDLDRVVEARVVHVDGSDLDASIAAAERARAAGRVVTCDLDHATPRTPELLAHIDICMAAAEFPADLARACGALPAGETGAETLSAALRRIAGYLPAPAVVCITRGAEGAVAWDGEGEYQVPAFHPPAIVDTTACGDTFRGGFIAALLDGQDLAGCLTFACAAAALKTRDLGRRGCPGRDAVQALLQHGAWP